MPREIRGLRAVRAALRCASRDLRRAQLRDSQASPPCADALYAFLGAGAGEGLHPELRVRGGHRSGALKLTRHDLGWNGKDFTVKVRDLELPAGQSTLTL